MDNAPSLVMLLAVVIVGTVAAFLTSRYRPLLLVVVLAFICVFFAIQYAQLLDPVIGPEVRAQASAFYVFVSWSGLFFVFAGGVIGLLVRRSAGTKAR
jgi:hypothetical protein